jgi:hypothetical protein
MQMRMRRGAGVGNRYAAITSIHGIAQGGMHAHLGRHTRNDELLDSALLQDPLQLGAMESVVARFVHHRLAGSRREFRDQIVTVFPSNQQQAHRSRGSDRRAGALAAFELGSRAIRQVGKMTLSRMNYGESRSTSRFQQSLDGRNDGGEWRDVQPRGVRVTAAAQKSRCMSMTSSAACARSMRSAGVSVCASPEGATCRPAGPARTDRRGCFRSPEST